MVVTATEFKTNFGKYLDLLPKEDIFITRDGKTVAKAVNPNVSAVDAISGPYINPIWKESLDRYRYDDTVLHLLFVQCASDSSNAVVQFYEKDAAHNCAWTIVLECNGYIGKNGISRNKREGDNKTPTGNFGVTTAFGIKPNPGTKLHWIDVTDDLWVPDQPGKGYNTIVSTRNGGKAVGEHLIEYSPQYNYAMFLDYNDRCVPQKGSAIFFHCTGYADYTGGCIAVSEANMISIIQRFCPYDRIIIAPKKII